MYKNPLKIMKYQLKLLINVTNFNLQNLTVEKYFIYSSSLKIHAFHLERMENGCFNFNALNLRLTGT